MVNTVLTETILGISLLFSTAIASPSASVHPVSSLQYAQEYHYVVKKDDTFKQIAERAYGSEAYWTTVWNDNPQINDPFSIEEGDNLLLRFAPPMVIEYLNEPLQKRLDTKSIPTHASIAYTIVPSATPTIATSTPTTTASGPLNDAQIAYLGHCESGMTATRNSGNGFYGAFQFMPSTWRAMNTGYERADFAPLEVQKEAVQRLLSRSSIYTQFPGCARKMQLAGLL